MRVTGRQRLRGNLADRAVHIRHHNCGFSLRDTHFIARRRAAVGNFDGGNRRDVLSLRASVAHRRARRSGRLDETGPSASIARSACAQKGEA